MTKRLKYPHSLLRLCVVLAAVAASTVVALAQGQVRIVSVQGCGLSWLGAFEDERNDFRAVHWPPQNNDTQRWQMTPERNGTYRFKQLSSGRYLDAHEIMAMGFRIVTRPYQQDNTQEWRVTGYGGNFVTIQQASSGRFVECTPNQPALYTNVQTGADTQTWRLADVAPPTPLPPPVASSGSIIRTGAGLCLDVHAPDIAKNGGRVQTWACNSQPHQRWTYDRAASAIRVSSGLCLDVNSPEMTTNGGRVQVWACSGAPQQQWTPLANGSLRNGGGLCLDVHAADQARNGARVQIWQCNGSQQQRFAFGGSGVPIVVTQVPSPVAPPPVVTPPAAAPPSGEPVQADNVRQWHVENSDTVNGGEPYELHNLRRRALNFSSQFGYVPGTRSGWGWPGHSGGHFVFVRHNNKDRSPVSDTEVVAIYNTLAKQYLVYQRGGGPVVETVTFSTKPSFEWMIHQRQGPNFALYSVNKGRYLQLVEDNYVTYWQFPTRPPKP